MGNGSVLDELCGLLRAVRRRLDMSQRELAAALGVSHAAIGRIEAGSLVPSLALFRQIMVLGGIDLVAVDTEGRAVEPMSDRDDLRDGAGRRYPAHLDVIVDPDRASGEWWGYRYGLAAPPETFYRNRQARDARRARSRWEVRVAQCRHLPPPPRLPPRSPVVWPPPATPVTRPLSPWWRCLRTMGAPARRPPGGRHGVLSRRERTTHPPTPHPDRSVRVPRQRTGPAPPAGEHVGGS